MELHVRNAHGQLPTPIIDHAAKRVEKLEKYLHKIGKVEFVHDELRGRHIIELQLNADGYNIRGTGEATDLHAAIDSAVDHVEDRLKRFRNKLMKKHNGRGNGHKELELVVDETVVQEDEPRISKIKTFTMKPITPEEAVLQMELQGRDFYIFNNVENNQVCLLYRLPSGNYGLIGPE